MDYAQRTTRRVKSFCKNAPIACTHTCDIHAYIIYTCSIHACILHYCNKHIRSTHACCIHATCRIQATYMPHVAYMQRSIHSCNMRAHNIHIACMQYAHSTHATSMQRACNFHAHM